MSEESRENEKSTRVAAVVNERLGCVTTGKYLGSVKVGQTFG